MSDQSTAHLGNYFTQSLKDRDPELFASMQDEYNRQQHEIELIASETVSYTHLTLPTIA